MNFKNAFKRKAKQQSKQITRPHMHWRHKENGWEVVSTVLCDKWDNAVHPTEHDNFNTKVLGDTDADVDDDGVPIRHSPESPGEWETFMTDETYTPRIFDREAYSQFESAFRNVDFLDAEAAAEFLHDTFEAEYAFDDPYNECSECGGTGRYCDDDNCITYCSNDCGSGDEPLRVSDDACSCTTCNFETHWVECEECDGTGETYRESFTRTFPYTRDAILSEMPTKRELQVIQFTVNKMANIASDNDTAVSFRRVLRLFDALENNGHDALVETAVSYIEPSLDTVKAPKRNAENEIVTDETGKPVMEEHTDPEAVQEMKVKFTAMLNDISKQQAEKQVA